MSAPTVEQRLDQLEALLAYHLGPVGFERVDALLERGESPGQPFDHADDALDRDYQAGPEVTALAADGDVLGGAPQIVAGDRCVAFVENRGVLIGELAPVVHRAGAS